jgi:hypothetical protein
MGYSCITKSFRQMLGCESEQSQGFSSVYLRSLHILGQILARALVIILFRQ